MKTMKLVDLAKTIRSKNAGTDRITFDIIFRDPENYEKVKKSGILNKTFIANLYGIPESRIVDFVEFDEREMCSDASSIRRSSILRYRWNRGRSTGCAGAVGEGAPARPFLAFMIKRGGTKCRLNLFICWHCLSQSVFSLSY